MKPSGVNLNPAEEFPIIWNTKALRQKTTQISKGNSGLLMMTVNGLVISERIIGENDKYISVLTAEYGTIDVFVNGGNKITGKNQSATQLFSYSKLCMTCRKERFYLNSSELIYDFFNLRLDIRKLTLACYFGEVIRYSVLAHNIIYENGKLSDTEVMRLTLNCLYMLSENKRSCEFIKSVFEMRFLCEIGLRPQLIGCKVCYAYENEDFFFLINQSYVLCEYHFEENGLDENDYNIRITPSQFAALQFICFSDMERLFNFRVSPESQAKLNEVTEKYILANMSRSFRSLEYYKTLLP